MKDKIKYIYPIAQKDIIRISTKESEAHKIYPHSIDFIVPIGTLVMAAADGVVIDIKDDSDKSGTNRKFEKDENFIEIRHYKPQCFDQYSYYGHIKKGSAKVKVGDKVIAGQIIAESGATGWLANILEPHLHFMVAEYDYRTIEIKFAKE